MRGREICSLSLHDALPISVVLAAFAFAGGGGSHSPQAPADAARPAQVSRQVAHRSEEHTSELQSQFHLVCRLLLEKKKHLDAQQLPSRLKPTTVRVRRNRF